jgi:hypothetical protein
MILKASERARAARFLKKFNNVFTVYYDLPLYWIMAVDLKDDFDDGFRGHTQLTWRTDGVEQNVFYLHGALHIWDEWESVREVYCKAGENFLGNVANNFHKNRYPLFISEDSSKQKRARIRESAYLGFGYQALRTSSEPLLAASLRSIARWERDASPARLHPDQLERISYILGIFSGLHAILGDSPIADEWVRRSNLDFGGMPPIERMLMGNVGDLAYVRAYVDRWRSGP